MRLRHIIAATAGLSMLAMASPALAAPAPPSVSVDRSVTIAWHQCIDLFDLVTARLPKGTDQTGSTATLRKVGLSRGFDDTSICGYMGSGTFTGKIRFGWQYKVTKQVEKPIYGPNPAVFDIEGYPFTRVPFTCTQTGDAIAVSYPGPAAMYTCPFDGRYAGLGTFEQAVAGSSADIDADLPDGAAFDPECHASQQCGPLVIVMPSGVTPPATFTGTHAVDLEELQEKLAIEVPEQIVTGHRTVTQSVWVKGRTLTVPYSVRVSVRYS